MGAVPGGARLVVLAREAAAVGTHVHEVRARLTGLDALDWDGASAAAFRSRLAELTRATTAVATACDEAAARLAAHGLAVDAVGHLPAPGPLGGAA